MTEPILIDGSCHCGRISYEARVDPERIGLCHCTDCQVMSGSAFRTVALVPAADFRLVEGEPAEFVKTADSGNRRVQAFCGHCGTALFATEAGETRRAYSIRLGTARQHRQLVPRFECWVESALPWVTLCPGTRKFPKRPKFD